MGDAIGQMLSSAAGIAVSGPAGRARPARRGEGHGLTPVLFAESHSIAGGFARDHGVTASGPCPRPPG